MENIKSICLIFLIFSKFKLIFHYLSRYQGTAQRSGRASNAHQPDRRARTHNSKATDRQGIHPLKWLKLSIFTWPIRIG